MTIQIILESHRVHKLLWCQDQSRIWLQITTQKCQKVKMFVSESCLSEVDISLSQVNTLLSEVNMKLAVCPVEVRKSILPRIQHILSEMMWTVSMSSEESSESECDVSSYSADVESLSWDSSEDFYYKLYYEEEEDEDYEEEEERTFGSDDHGPINLSEDSSANAETIPHEDESNLEDFRKVERIVRKVPASPGWIAPKIGPAVEIDSSSTPEDSDSVENLCEVLPDATTDGDDGVRFVDEMLTKINSLAPNGLYKVTRVRKALEYTIDLTKVNQFFLRNIPKPEYFPIFGCSDDPEFYSDERIKTDIVDYYGNRQTLPPRHKQKAPFGSLYGYKTDVGIIPVPNQSIFGHVWKGRDGEGWVLQAQVDDGVPAGGPWSPPPRTRGGRPSG